MSTLRCNCGQLRDWGKRRCKRCGSSPESACYPAGMRGTADQGGSHQNENGETEVTTPDDVSRVTPTKEASEDWLLELREVLHSWKELKAGKTMLTAYAHGFKNGLAVAIRDLDAWLANRSESKN